LKTFIVAEIGSNWEGDIEKAKKIIKECKKANANAVKFQIWRAVDLYSKNHPQWKFIKKSELTFEKIEKIKKFADNIGIEFFASVFYPEAVDFLESLKIKRYKIASRTCLLKDPYSKEILEKIAKTRKPVIISMGMGGNRKYLERLFSKNKKRVFCYCISKYPLKLEEINWEKALKYNGFSDHTLGIVAPIVFVALKNQLRGNDIFLEKHVKIPQSKGPDASTSMDVNQLRELISYIRIIEKNNFL